MAICGMAGYVKRETSTAGSSSSSSITCSPSCDSQWEAIKEESRQNSLHFIAGISTIAFLRASRRPVAVNGWRHRRAILPASYRSRDSLPATRRRFRAGWWSRVRNQRMIRMGGNR
jgi:hypothetical protein